MIAIAGTNTSGIWLLEDFDPRPTLGPLAPLKEGVMTDRVAKMDRRRLLVGGAGLLSHHVSVRSRAWSGRRRGRFPNTSRGRTRTT